MIQFVNLPDSTLHSLILVDEKSQKLKGPVTQRKRMNHAQILCRACYIRDLRISSVFLAWNFHIRPPMYARPGLYAITGFELLKTRLDLNPRKSLCGIQLI